MSDEEIEYDEDTTNDMRRYVRITEDIAANMKMNSISDPMHAIAAQVIAICAAASGLTDGHVPLNVLKRSGVEDVIMKEMIVEGIWHDEHHSCGRCPRPRPGMIYVHDYLRHQRSSSDVKSQRKKKSAAGSKGAEIRWANHRARQAAERNKAVEKAKAAGEPTPVREDVEKLCNYMADRIQANDSKGRRPEIGQAWLNDMRYMLDIDNFSKEELGQVIRWASHHYFWHDKIKSPHKLRIQLRPDKNDLMGKMRADLGKVPDDVIPQKKEPTSMRKAMSVADRLDAEHAAQQQKEIAA